MKRRRKKKGFKAQRERKFSLEEVKNVELERASVLCHISNNRGDCWIVEAAQTLRVKAKSVLQIQLENLQV